jgi:hypothetical protein
MDTFELIPEELFRSTLDCTEKGLKLGNGFNGLEAIQTLFNGTTPRIDTGKHKHENQYVTKFKVGNIFVGLLGFSAGFTLRGTS